MITSRAFTGERLVNVLQSIALEQQTGRLSVAQGHGHGGEQGEIFFVRGNTIYARTRDQLGETALFTMLHWQEIQCIFAEGVEAPQRTPPLQHRRANLQNRSRGSLLPIELEVTRQTPAIGMPAIPRSAHNTSITAPRSEMYSYLANQSFTGTSSLEPGLPPQPSHKADQPGIDAIFRAAPHVSIPKIINQMERKDRIVFLLLDGKRPLSTIRHLVHRSEADIASTISSLLRQGYIEYIQG